MTDRNLKLVRGLVVMYDYVGLLKDLFKRRRDFFHATPMHVFLPGAQPTATTQSAIFWNVA